MTRDGANDLAPSFSADGEWLYFGSNRGDGLWQIWKMPATGGAPRQVTRDGGYLALESGDGRTLYFTRYGEKGLFRQPLAGGESTSVEHSRDLVGAEHWTVVEDTLYLVVTDDEGIRVIRLVDGSEPETLRTLDRVRLMAGLAVSPDEASLLLAEITRLEADLWRVDFEES